MCISPLCTRIHERRRKRKLCTLSQLMLFPFPFPLPLLVARSIWCLLYLASGTLTKLWKGSAHFTRTHVTLHVVGLLKANSTRSRLALSVLEPSQTLATLFSQFYSGSVHVIPVIYNYTLSSRYSYIRFRLLIVLVPRLIYPLCSCHISHRCS
jgi:hypothetical protein